MTTQDRGSWGSRWGFILAAAGSAVGLGNIWKFPYITGENGGGLFVLIYLVCIGLVGMPIMLAELMIGRAAQKQPVSAFHELQGGRTGWAAIGWLGVVAGFVILSFYIVVAGWAMDYALKAVVNFSEPAAAEAAVEAKTYRASASMESMREYLAERKGQREARDPVREIQGEIKPKVWALRGDFDSALKEAGGGEEARMRLLEVPAVAEAVVATGPVLDRIQEKRDEVMAEAAAFYAAKPDKEIRDEAEDAKRREVIAAKIGAKFGALATDGWTASFWAALFMLITILIVAGGISGGIERTCKILMPTLITIMIGMVIYGLFQPGFGEAFSFVFKPDATKLKPSGVLEALGHAFFTLSLGMGAMITYGSYQKTKDGLAKEGMLIAIFDTVIALLACMMIFPIIFSYGQEPGAGPGLVFVSMPLAFAEIGTGGMALGILFFGLLVFAALTSAISLLEVVCSYFIDEKGWPRRKTVWIIGGVVLAFGFPSAWAMSPDFSFSSWEGGYGKNFFDTMDYLASNWLLPLGGLFIAIYAGWVMPKRFRDAQLEGLSPALIGGWLFLVRYIAPILVILVLVQKVKILPIDDWLHGWF